MALTMTIRVRWGHYLMKKVIVTLDPKVSCLETELERIRREINKQVFTLSICTSKAQLVKEDMFGLFQRRGTNIKKEEFEKVFLNKTRQPKPIEKWRPTYKSKYWKTLVTTFTTSAQHSIIRHNLKNNVIAKLLLAGYVEPYIFVGNTAGECVDGVRITNKGAEYLYRMLQKNLRCVRDEEYKGVLEMVGDYLRSKGLLKED